MPRLGGGRPRTRPDRGRQGPFLPRQPFLKRNREVATRYGKLAVRYEAALHIACINGWLRPYSKKVEPEGHPAVR
jgi:transposase